MDGYVKKGLQKYMGRNREGVEKQEQEILDRTVFKPLNLLDVWRSELTLTELKLLDVYMARINVHDVKTKEVNLGIRELEKIMGVRVNSAELRQRLLHFIGNTVSIPISDDGQCVNITLFQAANIRKTEKGRYYVEMICTEMAQKYFFNADRIGYLKYELRNIISLKSRFSYIMFLYLERHRQCNIMEWVEEYDRLREIFACSGSKFAEEYKFFNRAVFKVAHEELTKKIGYMFSYQRIRNGGVRFTLEENSGLKSGDFVPTLLGGMIGSDISDQVCRDIERADAVFDPESFLPEPKRFLAPAYMEPVFKYELSAEIQEELNDVLNIFPQVKDGVSWAPSGEKWDGAYKKFLKRTCIKLDNIIEERKGTDQKIRDVGRYLIKMVNNEVDECKTLSLSNQKKLEDVKPSQGNKKDKSKMNSAEKYLARYEQREYSEEDMLNIERMMIERSMGSYMNRTESGQKEDEKNC